MANKDGWGDDIAFRVHLSNGETILKTLTVDELRVSSGGDPEKVLNTLTNLVGIFRNWRSAEYLAVELRDKDIFINPAHIMYVETMGFSSWEPEG